MDAVYLERKMTHPRIRREYIYIYIYIHEGGKWREREREITTKMQS